MAGTSLHRRACLTSLVLALVALCPAAQAVDDSAAPIAHNATPTACEACCSPGGGGDACASAFKGGPGTCCGMGALNPSKAFCCPSRANFDVGFAACYPSAVDDGYRCRQQGDSGAGERRSYRRGDDDDGSDFDRAGGISPFTVFLGCIFTAFLVKGCLARQREQIAQEYAYHFQQQHASGAAMGVPIGPDGQPIGGIQMQAMGGAGMQHPNYAHPRGMTAGAGYGVGGLAGAGG
eukprot:CAMPEP_0181362446 /NCGR_PEP_ID=MMETSP1106-20121128/8018_1 /TAXON_ID=81844 /ORGANISM="Mantoniella antarctica, Strain SL-175" /LENGTH=234 /DNA_ID=CAMNT_0023476415 /DNA_START=288 /DNA_END=989 /DNA_ORIENTATION=+